MQCDSRRALRAALLGLGWSGRLQTAFVERRNRTARQSVAALTRRTWATAQTATGLQAQIDWWRGYYHFSRPHLSVRGYARACTPAMAAGLTTHRWTVSEFLGYPCVQAG
jgi:Integrase core domain